MKRDYSTDQNGVCLGYSQKHFRVCGIALIEATSFVFIVLLLLSAVLLVVQSRRERIQKKFYNVVVESEGRALVLDLRRVMADRIRQTGGFDPLSWDPVGTVPSAVLGGTALTSRSVAITGGAVGAFPSQPSLMTTSHAVKGDPLYKALSRQVNLSMHDEWTVPDTGNKRTMTAWHLDMPIQVDEVPLSIFNYYASSATERLLSGGSLGRVHGENDVSVESPVYGGYPITVGGSFSVSPGGAWFGRLEPAQSMSAFAVGTSPTDWETQGMGLVYARDMAPVSVCRPVTTAELFSPVGFGNADKERQRLKPQCDLVVSVDAVGVPTATWKVTPVTPVNLQPVFSVAMDTSTPPKPFVVIDLSLWPPGAPWPASLWIESSDPNVFAVRIKNGKQLPSAFSLATPYQLQVEGNFNTQGVVQRASLLTPKQVVFF